MGHDLRHDESGMTLIEVMVAAVILVTGILGTVTLVDRANGNAVRTKGREAATNLLRELAEDVHAVPYPQITTSGVLDRLSDLPGLEDPSGTQDGYQLTRRGFVFTVSATACSVDDPQDDLGTHDTGAAFCSGGAAGSTDKNPDDYKRVVLTATWKADSQPGTVTQTTLVNNPGSVFGPRIMSLATTSGANATRQVLDPAVRTVGFRAVTSVIPATEAWYLDGSQQTAVSSPASTNYDFSWDLGNTNNGVTDGTYVVSAQAFDAAGITGQSRALTVVVDRTAPTAPAGFQVGRNGSVVDLDWNANPERDVVGYTVFRTGAPDVAVCSLITTSACQDFSPPAGTPSYYVRAYDQNIGGHGAGAASPTKTVVASNTAPNPPTALAGAHSAATGATTLSWTASTGDPDAGDSIAYYRIYRDGSTYADRYDKTGLGTETTWTDANTGGTAHTYWVTAVDQRLAESTILGPITR